MRNLPGWGEVPDNESRGYALWLIPEKVVYDSVDKIIHNLSKKYSTPILEPHISLISNLEGSEEEIIKKTRKLIGSISQFNVTVHSIVNQGEYLKCILIKMDKTPELMDANLQAKKMFDRMDAPKYTPHMSLIYGYIIDDKRWQIVAEVSASQEWLKLKRTFEINKLGLYSTDGPVEKWYKVKDFDFVKSKAD